MSSLAKAGLEGMQTAPLPADLAFALQSEHEARRAFAALPAGRRARLVLGIEGAVTPGDRRRRVASAIDELRATA